MLRFISFGSGSSGNCYVLSNGSDALMIDAGIGVRTLRKEVREYGVNLSLVSSILITHDHADHIKSVGSLSHELCLPVYATEAVHKGIERNYCVKYKVQPDRKQTLTPGQSLRLGAFEVTPFHVPHDSSDNVGYTIQAEDSTFVIITDAGHVTDEMARQIAQADFLVIEANHDPEMLRQGPYPQVLKLRINSEKGHLSNNDCAEAIARNCGPQLKHVWLCHLSEENNHPELARKTVETVLRSYGIVAGKDFLLDVLRRQRPTGIFDLTT